MSSPARPRSPLGPIFLIVLVDVLSLTIMIPLLPFYAQAFGASAFTVGTLFAVFAACQLVSGPILGNLSDRLGRRPLLLSSQAGMVASLLVMAFAESLALLFVGRIISGLTAGNLTIAQAYITDHTPPEARTRAFGVIGIAFGVGFAIGPAISGWLADFDPETATHAEMIASMARPLFLAAALSTLSFFTTFFLLRDDRPAAAAAAAADAPDAPPPPAGRRLGLLEWRGYLAFFRRPGLASLLWQFFLFTTAFSMFIGGFALFAERRYTWDGHPFGAREVGYIYSYVGFLGIIIQGGLLRPLSRRWGDATLVVHGFLFTAVGYLLLGFAGSVMALVAVSTVTSYGNGVLRPALTARVTQVVERHEQGVVLGLTQSLQALSAVFGPLLATALIDQTGLRLVEFAAGDPAGWEWHDTHWLVWWAAVAAAVSAIGLVAALASRRAALPPTSAPR